MKVLDPALDADVERRLAGARSGEQRLGELSEGEAQALWQRVRALTSAGRGTWRGRLRELPTRLRVVITLAGAALVATLVALIAEPREVFSATTIARYAVLLSALALLAVASFAVSLRGEQAWPLRKKAWVVIALTLALPVLLALMPGIWEPDGEAPATDSGYFCTLIGLAVGALVSVPAFLMQRAAVPVMARACAALAGGGVVAFGLLELHCPSRAVTHLLLGHAAVGAVLVVLAALAVWWRRR